MLKINTLTKKFGNSVAVDNISLNIAAGEFYCLLGPNGAGKTTTLKIVTGLMRPTDGEVLINGLDIYKHYMKVKKMLGFIPDTPFLYENLTPIEFLKFIADIFHLEPRNFKNRVDYYFGLFNLDKFRNTLIKELSHGMRQKIVYIANFIHQPSIYLIDEPLVGLDPYSIHLLKRILKEKTAAGATILMCTHILSIAEELADRIGILHHGRIIAQGRAGELKNKLAVSSLEEAFLKITCQSP